MGDSLIQMASVFRKEFTISSYELNPRGEARLTTMANYMQEVAYHHASELGFGFDQMKERQTLWMLSRMRIRMYGYPVWNDTIVVETWPSGIDKIFATRDFRVTDLSGNVLGVASTYWLIVNLENHRPVRPGMELARFSEIIYGEEVFETKLVKLEVPEGTEMLGKHRVQFSDLDIVGHVNNVKYMEWCVDAAMPEGLTDKAIGEFEINFLHEALLGNHVVLKGVEGVEGSKDEAAGDKFFCLSATREEDGQEVIRARIAWLSS